MDKLARPTGRVGEFIDATLRNPYVCPNTPRCPHPALLHDIEDYADISLRCCFDDCSCGAKVVDAT